MRSTARRLSRRPGLGELSGSLRAIARFLRVDVDLLGVAASPSLSKGARSARTVYDLWDAAEDHQVCGDVEAPDINHAHGRTLATIGTRHNPQPYWCEVLA
jgi:hypothetical protein